MAQEKNLKINEYGVFKGRKQIAGETEEEIYALFDLPYIAPELREDRGEIEAAANGRLPTLITLDDIRGDLQMHTTASDGKSSLQDMTKAAQKRGYEYIAITDHSKYVRVAQGLDEERLAQQIEDIARLNEQLDGIQVLKSAEVDILKDGSLDLADDILKELDLVVCSIHAHFKLSQKQQTTRIIRAMDNPYFTILAHPAGRKIGARAPYDVEMEQIMQAALERGCFLELNAHPERLDLNEVYCKMAKEMGLKISIATDAHRRNGLDYMRFGIGQAQRGWLEAEDVLNTRSLKALKSLLKR
jgi:DNA polymerase (family 10)